MPWHEEKRGDEFCVIEEGGKVVKCHPTREAAMDHIRALYANTSSEHHKDAGESLVLYGGAVKALGSGRVGGYLITYSDAQSPDKSTFRDFFDGETDYDLDDGAGKASVYYSHGQDRTLKKRRLAKGAVKQTDVGVWIEAQLSMRDEYERAIYELAEKNKLGWSSGSVSHLVEREPVKDGDEVIAHHVLHWPIAEASLTPTPAEPRCGVFALKSLEVPALLPAPEDEKPSLAERTERWLDTGTGLLAGYQQVKAAETKVGRALSAARRGRLEQARQLIDDLLSETVAARDEHAEAAQTEAAGTAAPLELTLPPGDEYFARLARSETLAAG